MANKALKVMVPEIKGRAPFSGMSHGLKFENGVSEKIDDPALYERLVLKGYKPYIEQKTSKKETE